MTAEHYPSNVVHELLQRAGIACRDAFNLAHARGAHYDEVYGRTARENMAALREFVENGWPPQEVVGQAAAEAALLLVIHCPSLELQEHCRRLIGLSVQRGNSPAEHLQVLAMVLWLQQSCRQQEALAPDYGGAYESAGWGALQTTN